MNNIIHTLELIHDTNHWLNDVKTVVRFKNYKYRCLP